MYFPVLASCTANQPYSHLILYLGTDLIRQSINDTDARSA